MTSPACLLRSASFEVVEIPAIYVVYYRNAPFTLRRPPERGRTTRYRRTAFSVQGHAERLAHRLNTAFDTADFTVEVTR